MVSDILRYYAISGSQDNVSAEVAKPMVSVHRTAQFPHRLQTSVIHLTGITATPLPCGGTLDLHYAVHPCISSVPGGDPRKITSNRACTHSITGKRSREPCTHRSTMNRTRACNP